MSNSIIFPMRIHPVRRSRAPGWIHIKFHKLSIKSPSNEALSSSRLDSYQIVVFTINKNTKRFVIDTVLTMNKNIQKALLFLICWLWQSTKTYRKLGYCCYVGDANQTNIGKQSYLLFSLFYAFVMTTSPPTFRNDLKQLK